MKTLPLPKKEQESLLEDFCEALAILRTPAEVLPFLTDILTRAEVLMLTKRLHIAQLLLDGKGYRTIEKELRVSHGTVARVSAWLEESGEGFRMVAEHAQKQKKKEKPAENSSEWTKLKRKYPIMFWPQLLMEEVVKNANTKDRQRIQKAVEQLDRKSDLYRHLSGILHGSSKSKKSKKYNAT